MLLKTYNKIIDIFNIHHGYMSFNELLNEKVTILQIRELEEMGILSRFSRGWYWCLGSDFKKPVDYKYIEVAKVNPKSIICMESACYLHGVLKIEPDVISVSTSREDRSKMELNFPIKRFFLKNTGEKDEIQTVTTEFGNYETYSLERCYCDCFRMKSKLDSEIYLNLVEEYRKQKHQKERIYAYAKSLRAISCITDLE